MPQTIDGLSYPETAAELIADRALLQVALNTFTSAEVQNRIAFLTRPCEPLQVYETYIAQKASKRFALPNVIKDKAADLVEAGVCAPEAWQGISEQIEAHCRAFVEERVLPALLNTKKCRNFEKYHKAALLRQAPTGGAGDVALMN